jgi:hypothetical protein
MRRKEKGEGIKERDYGTSGSRRKQRTEQHEMNRTTRERPARGLGQLVGLAEIRPDRKRVRLEVLSLRVV